MLDDGDKALLGQCPLTVTIIKARKVGTAEARRLARIKTLTIQGYLSGRVKSADALMQVMQVELTDKGRAAIGRPPLGGAP